jgi:hypothetical protein
VLKHRNTKFEVTAGEVVTAILTVDIDRLSAIPVRAASRKLRQAGSAGDGNSRIAAALREEELALAAQRADMAPTVFRTEAET